MAEETKNTEPTKEPTDRELLIAAVENGYKAVNGLIGMTRGLQMLSQMFHQNRLDRNATEAMKVQLEYILRSKHPKDLHTLSDGKILDAIAMNAYYLAQEMEKHAGVAEIQAAVRLRKQHEALAGESKPSDDPER